MIRQICRFQNRQWIEKNRPQNTKEAQNVVFNLKGRVPLLFYCAKHIHGQFKTYKKYPDCWEKPCRNILLNN
jgi:hypothetical protein